MNFLHLSDLHIGKRVNEFLMLDEQEFALKQILKICDKKNVDTVLIAGDVYDRSIPIIEGVKLFDWFLTELIQKDISIFIISGNHDSPQRLSFGRNIMQKSKIYIEGVFNGEIKKIEVDDEHGKVNIYMLPFVRPNDVKDENGEHFKDYTKAVEYLIKNTKIDTSERNIILSHQFVTKIGEDIERCESEAISVGGLDNVESYVYNDFDYTALGHLHSPQKVGNDNIRYSGSIVKYSFSEAKHKKTVPFVNLGKKGDINIEFIPILPLKDMREIKGKIEDILDLKENRNDYIKAILTNEDEVYDAVGRLRAVYPNLMKIEFENKKSHFNQNSKTGATELIGKTPQVLFEEFFEIQNNIGMNNEQKKIISDIFKEIEGEKDEAY